MTLVTSEKDGKVYAHYVCADKWYSSDESPGGYFCGFDVNTLEDHRKYLAIMNGVQHYIFYLLYHDKCRCGQQTRAVVERITVGQQPAYLRSIQLNNELQLFYICNDDVCGYRLSVPQIVGKRLVIKCLCGRVCLYHDGVYSWLCRVFS